MFRAGGGRRLAKQRLNSAVLASSTLRDQAPASPAPLRLSSGLSSPAGRLFPAQLSAASAVLASQAGAGRRR